MRINIKLKQVLSENDMSQHKIADITGIRQATINAMCRNRVSHIPLNNLAALCEALECNITDILELEPE